MVRLDRRSLYAIAIMALLLIACVVYQKTRTAGEEKSAATIALYSQNVWQQGYEPTKKMLESIGYKLAPVTAEDINEGRLDGFMILLIPGGDSGTYSHDITSEGKENIRRFIYAGGAYIGICGGSLFAYGNWNLDLIQRQVASSSDLDLQGTCRINIADPGHPVAQSLPQSFDIYCTGIIIRPDKDSNVTVVGTYEANGKDAMVAFEYGRGRVFLFGPHPEFNEDNWRLMKNVIRWCLHETTVV